jgi:hypothetical protein
VRTAHSLPASTGKKPPTDAPHIFVYRFTCEPEGEQVQTSRAWAFTNRIFATT